jgi:putative colanic acid biosynthesis glycosyltransferase
MRHTIMLLSVITVAWRNLAGVQKTWQSLAHLAQASDITFEWVVVDGNSQDGTAEFLEKLNGQYNLRFVSEKDNGIYDAMNKGIAMAQGRYALFLNSGDIFHPDIADFIRQMAKLPAENNAMVIGDALLDFGDGTKIQRRAKPGCYIYHSLPASHQAIFFPLSGLRKYPYDLQYKVSSDYALAARMYKNGYAFKRLKGFVSEFSMGGVSTSNNIELCRDAKNVQRKILGVPGFIAELSFKLRLRTTGKAKALYNKA